MEGGAAYLHFSLENMITIAIMITILVTAWGFAKKLYNNQQSS